MAHLGRALIAALIAAASWATAMNAPVADQSGQVIKVPCGRSLSAVRPAAGSTLELRRGCQYHGPLTIAARHVTVTAYGSGAPPEISLAKDGATVDVLGSHATIKDLRLTGRAPASWHCGGKATPAGHVDGVDIHRGSSGDTVAAITATGFYAGVYIMTGATGNTVRNSTFTNNTELDHNNRGGSAGAFGILLWGSANTVRDNHISGNQACSLAYGRDGSAVEVYGGSGNLITNNTGFNDSSFVELGSAPGRIAADNAIVGNTVSNGPVGQRMTFITTRGSGNVFGPVYRTTAIGNIVTLTRPGDQGAVSYAWRSMDGTLLTLTGNYLDLGTNPVLRADGGLINAGGNTFIGSCNPTTDC